MVRMVVGITITIIHILQRVAIAIAGHQIEKIMLDTMIVDTLVIMSNNHDHRTMRMIIRMILPEVVMSPSK